MSHLFLFCKDNLVVVALFSSPDDISPLQQTFKNIEGKVEIAQQLK